MVLKGGKDKDPKKITKKDLAVIFADVLKHMKKLPEGHFKLKKMRGICGICEWSDGITLDYRKPVIPTIIHEVLHDMYPDGREEWVLRVESKIIQILSAKDIYKLLSLFLAKLEIKKKLI